MLIRLTQSVWLNPDHIVAVTVQPNGVLVQTVRDNFIVSDSVPEEVIGLIQREDSRQRVNFVLGSQPEVSND